MFEALLILLVLVGVLLLLGTSLGCAKRKRRAQIAPGLRSLCQRRCYCPRLFPNDPYHMAAYAAP